MRLAQHLQLRRQKAVGRNAGKQEGRQANAAIKHRAQRRIFFRLPTSSVPPLCFALCAAQNPYRIEAVVDVRVLRIDTAAQGRVEPGCRGVDVRRRAGGGGEGGYAQGSQTKERELEEKSRHGGCGGGGRQRGALYISASSKKGAL